MGGLVLQICKFVGTSGIGWILDFCLFNLLGKAELPYAVCNIFSSFLGVTYVFFVATRKIFATSLHKLTLYQKYMIYIAYQAAMIMLSSLFIGLLSAMFSDSRYALLSSRSGICAKIAVTPFTMTFNFLFMKILTEKI